MSDSRVADVAEPGKVGAHGIVLEYNGVRGNIMWWAKQLDMVVSTLYRRLRKNGWDLEAACSEPVKQLSRAKIVFNGRALSIRQWAKEVGIPNPTIVCRLKRGWPVEQALTIPPDAMRSACRRGEKAKGNRKKKEKK